MKALLLTAFLTLTVATLAQEADSVFHYRRASIYSLMVSHRNLNYSDLIEDAFKQMEVPDKYNDHNIGKRIFYTTDRKVRIDEEDHKGFVINKNADVMQMNDVDKVLHKQEVASRLVARWFGRKFDNEKCSMQLIQARGYENASELDKRKAALSVRGEDLLRDAGEELIGSTFVIVNDIRYIDRGKGSAIAGGFLKTAILVAGIASGVDASNTADAVNNMVSSIKGFNVKIKTYLYQLVWDKESADYFYGNIYTEKEDKAKKIEFEKNRGRFSLVYLGMQESSGKDVSFAGINEQEPQVMVLKACYRALDENIANLQKNFDAFKVKSPLLSAEPLRCEIGLKEGLTEDSQYEVLETVEDENGHISYNRVGVIRPVKGSIWDNRFMASEEGAPNADLGFTTFEKVRGGDFMPGMLVREIK